MTDINGLGSFSKITDLKEIANNKDMPILLKVSMFLNQLGLNKQAEAKTLIKDLDDTRNRATECGELVNALKKHKEYIEKHGNINIGHDVLSSRVPEIAIEEMNKLSRILKQLKSTFIGESGPIGSESNKNQEIQNLRDKAAEGLSELGIDVGEEFYDKSSFYNGDFLASIDKYINVIEIRKDIVLAGPDIYGKSLPSNINCDNLDSFAESLKNERETRMSTVQEKMVVIQDVMGQYNTLVQGSSTTMNKYADLSKALAQSMR